MVSTFQFAQSTGSIGQGTTGSQNYNFKNIDDVDIPGTGSLYSALPITTGSNSFSKYVYFSWTGTFNRISAVLFWLSTVNTGSGIAIVGNSGSAIQNTYTANYTSGSSDTTVPTTLATAYGVNVGQSGSTPSGSTSATGSTANPTISGWTRIQMTTNSNAAAGDTGTSTWSVQWTES